MKQIKTFLFHPISQWIIRTLFYLFIFIMLYWLYIYNGPAKAPFIYNEF